MPLLCVLYLTAKRSRFHEDKIIYDLFKNTTLQGTYVELGAFDGKEESNTIFFDKCLQWNGLLIEAQTKSYQKVIQNRPHAVSLSFSPTCKVDNGTTAKMYNYPLSNNGMEGLAKSYEGKEITAVPCGPLTPVLQDVFGATTTTTTATINNITHLSFFSLDVEGAELLVLETIDFNIIQIDVIMVEIQNSYCPNAITCMNTHNIRRLMAMTGKYALFVDFVEASDVYIRLGTEAYRRAKEIEQIREFQRKKRIHDNIMLLKQKRIHDIHQYCVDGKQFSAVAALSML